VPALQRLLGDIGEQLLDVVAVYKVDRLTCSLADFAKMVELFDAHRYRSSQSPWSRA
jgi:DNA invertase Pin-like site-specific DNA recombinase